MVDTRVPGDTWERETEVTQMLHWLYVLDLRIPIHHALKDQLYRDEHRDLVQLYHMLPINPYISFLKPYILQWTRNG